MTESVDTTAAPHIRRLLRDLEKLRGSKIITYVLSDRPGLPGQIAEDAVRPMYDHLLDMGPTEKIDLFLYSTGGHTEIPWRIVTMIRQFAEEFAVLVPYKAMSAATMVALGADEIVLGRKGELGPIDASLNFQRYGEGGVLLQDQVGVEDVMSYLAFIRERAEIKNEDALAHIITNLADKVDPRILGTINRQHSHIRDVARKLLTARNKKPAGDIDQIDRIISILAERTYQHGHAIGRAEAEDIGLNIAKPSDEVEGLMWELFEAYERVCQLRVPFDVRGVVSGSRTEYHEERVIGCMDSIARSDRCSGQLYVRAKRMPPPQLNLPVNAAINLPPTVQVQELPQQVQATLKQLLNDFQQQLPALVEQAIASSSPIIDYEVWSQDIAWRNQPDWATSS